MVQTYSDDKYIYSVDLMFVYIHYHKPKYIKIKVADLLDNLNHNGWNDDPNNDPKYAFSANDVMNNPDEHEADFLRIMNADLSYPIIITRNNNIVDGIHRLSKAYLEKKKYIKAYTFDSKLMKKFIITKKGNWDLVNDLRSYNLIMLYIERFLK